MYDKKNKKCLIHKNKPYVCLNYPWYGENDYKKFITNSEFFYNEDCGYKIDFYIFKIIIILKKLEKRNNER